MATNEMTDLDSVSAVDREPINGGKTETNWKDARKKSGAASSLTRGVKNVKPQSGVQPGVQLEDGAD